MTSKVPCGVVSFLLYLFVIFLSNNKAAASEHGTTSFILPPSTKLLDAFATYRPDSGIVIVMVGFGLRRAQTAGAKCVFRNEASSSSNLQLWSGQRGEESQDEAVVLCPIPETEYEWILSVNGSVPISITSPNSTKPVNVTVQTWPLRHQRNHDQKYKLAVTNMIRNEVQSCPISNTTRHCLIEWIEWYRMLGFEHFYLYDHISDDNVTSLLAPYIQADIVTLIHVNQPVRVPFTSSVMIQRAMMNHALFAVGGYETKYLAYFDVDEFILPNSASLQPVDDIICKAEQESFILEWNASELDIIKTNESHLFALQISQVRAQNPHTCHYNLSDQHLPLRMADCTGRNPDHRGAKKIITRPSAMYLPPPLITPHEYPPYGKDNQVVSSLLKMLHFSTKRGCGGNEMRKQCREQDNNMEQLLDYGKVLEKRVRSILNDGCVKTTSLKADDASFEPRQVPELYLMNPLILLAFLLVLGAFLSGRKCLRILMLKCCRTIAVEDLEARKHK